MAISLQDQLLGAGLTNKSKANKSKKDKYKQTKQQRSSKDASQENEITQLAKQAQADKQSKDLKLNQQQKAEADKKAITAQIKQLIKINRIKRDDDGVAYNFSDNNTVKKIYIDETMLQNIIKGKLAVVKYEKTYEVVAAQVAEKIKQRDAASILVLNDAPLESNDDNNIDDPYADFQIPDDLMW